MSSDHPNPTDIPEQERVPCQPAEPIAVLGSQHGRHWAPIILAKITRFGQIVGVGRDGFRIWNVDGGAEFFPCSPAIAASSPFPKGDSSKQDDDPDIVVAYEATGCNEGTFHLWAFTENGVADHTCYSWEDSNISALAVSPDKRAVAVGDDKGVVRLWVLDADNLSVPGSFGQGVKLIGHDVRLFGHDGRVKSIDFSPDGKWLVAADVTGHVRLWNLTCPVPRLTAVLECQSNDVQTVIFSHDSVTVASLDSATIRLWRLDELGNVQATSDLSSMSSYDDDLGSSIAFSPCGRRLAVGRTDGLIELWDLRAPAYHSTLFGDESREWTWGYTPLFRRVSRSWGPPPFLGTCVAFSTDGKTLVSGSEFGVIQLWNMTGRDPQKITPRSGNLSSPRWLAFAPDDSSLVSAEEDSDRLLLWDVRGPLPQLSEFIEQTGPMAFAPDGQVLAVASKEHPCIYLNCQDGNTWHRSGTVCKAQCPTPQYKRAHTSKRPTLKEAMEGTAAYLSSLYLRTRLLSFVAPHVLATANLNGEVCIWDLAAVDAGPRKLEVQGQPAAFSPEGSVLATFELVLPDGLARYKEMQTELAHLEINPNSWNECAFEVRLWELPEGIRRNETSFRVQGQWPVALSPKGTMLATLNNEGQVSLWDTKGKVVKTWSFPCPVCGVAFSWDGNYVATANTNGTIYILRIQPNSVDNIASVDDIA